MTLKILIYIYFSCRFLNTSLGDSIFIKHVITIRRNLSFKKYGQCFWNFIIEILKILQISIALLYFNIFMSYLHKNRLFRHESIQSSLELNYITKFIFMFYNYLIAIMINDLVNFFVSVIN